MSDRILQFVISPAIAGFFTVLAAWIASKFPRPKSRRPRSSVHHERRAVTALRDGAGQPEYQSEQERRSTCIRHTSGSFAIVLAIIALIIALLGLIGVFGNGRIIIGIIATAASLLAFITGGVINWSISMDEASDRERIRSRMQANTFVWIIAPVAGVALSLGLSSAGVNPIVAAAGASGVPLQAPFSVNAYYAPSGFMGDIAHISLNAQWTANCKVGPSCMRFQYKPGYAPDEPAWAGVYWQSPANNWGDQLGRRIEGATKLVFWARGEAGGELVSFKVGGIQGRKYQDSLEVPLEPSPVQLTSQWQQYEIDIKKQDTSSVIGAFSWSIAKDGNPLGATFYLDGIRIE